MNRKSFSSHISLIILSEGLTLQKHVSRTGDKYNSLYVMTCIENYNFTLASVNCRLWVGLYRVRKKCVLQIQKYFYIRISPVYQISYYIVYSNENRSGKTETRNVPRKRLCYAKYPFRLISVSILEICPIPLGFREKIPAFRTEKMHGIRGNVYY